MIVFVCAGGTCIHTLYTLHVYRCIKASVHQTLSDQRVSGIIELFIHESVSSIATPLPWKGIITAGPMGTTRQDHTDSPSGMADWVKPDKISLAIPQMRS